MGCLKDLPDLIKYDRNFTAHELDKQDTWLQSSKVVRIGGIATLLCVIGIIVYAGKKTYDRYTAASLNTDLPAQNNRSKAKLFIQNHLGTCDKL